MDGAAPSSPEEAAAMDAARSQVLRTAIAERIGGARPEQALALFERAKDTLAAADRRALEGPIAATAAWLARETGKNGTLTDRLGRDEPLTDPQRTILRAKIAARDSAEESSRVATIKGLDDRLAATTATLATQPSRYRIGTLAALADAYAAAGATEQANDTSRLALLEAVFLRFTQASPDRQQRQLDAFTGPERAMAEAILRHQQDAFARDPYATGTALYPEVGPPLPEEDAKGRLTQARMIEARRGISSFWVPVDATNQPNIMLAQSRDTSGGTAPQIPNGAENDGPPKRGIFVDPEPPPGSLEREAAEKEARPEIGGAFSGLGHWLSGNNEPRSYSFDKIDTTSVAPEQFADVQKILREGKPGTYPIDAKRGFWAGENFNSRFLVGNITLRLEGELTVEEGGKYVFKGNLGAMPDTYRMYGSDHRHSVDEAATRADKLMGTLGHGDYEIQIAGQKPISSSGTFEAQP